MKKILYLMAAVMTLGLASCTDTFDENDNDSVQPASPVLGFWQSDYTGTNVSDYKLTFSTTEAGDTIVEMTQRNKTNGRVDVYPEGKIVSYEDSVGILTVTFPRMEQNGSATGSTCNMTIVYEGTNGHSRAFVKCSGSCSSNFTISQCSAPDFGGYWNNDNLNVQFTRSTSADEAGNYGYVANGQYGETALPEGVWNEDGTSTIGVTLTTNSRYETVATYNGQQFIMHR